MKIIQYFKTVSISLLLLPAIASAASGLIEHDRVAYPRILVSPDGENYNDARIERNDEKIRVTIYLELDADRGNTIENFDISTGITHGTGIAHHVAIPRNESYSFIRIATDQQQRRFEKTLTQHINPRPLLGHAQDMCNQVAQNLRKRGKTNSEIFSRQRTAFFNVKTKASFITSDRSGTPILSTGNSRVYVTCLKETGINNRSGMADIPDVKRINITARKSTGKVCKLTLSGSIFTSHSNVNHTYQLMFNRRVLGETYTVRSRSNKIAKFTHVFPIDESSTVFNEATNTAPKRGVFQVVSVGLRSNVASYSINCLLPRLLPSTPTPLPGIKPKLKGL